VGIAQISQGKLDDFNSATGHKYKLVDMYDPVKSKEVFLWHISRYDLGKVNDGIRSWNGGGKMTFVYLKKVRSAMASS
jgi:hypothetical protein